MTGTCDICEGRDRALYELTAGGVEYLACRFCLPGKLLPDPAIELVCRCGGAGGHESHNYCPHCSDGSARVHQDAEPCF